MINDKLLIEYDGIQHFEEVEIFRESLTYIQKNDDIKNQYCKDNDIKLIRIPYWDYDRIEEILQKELATQIMVEA